MAVPQEVLFESGGMRCAADLYRPDEVNGSYPRIAAVVSQVPVIDGWHRGAPSPAPELEGHLAHRRIHGRRDP